MNPKWKRIELPANGDCISCSQAKAVWQNEKEHAAPRLCDGCAPAAVVLGKIVGYIEPGDVIALAHRAERVIDGASALHDDVDSAKAFAYVVIAYAKLRVDYTIANEAVTRVQERCSELLEETRTLRTQLTLRV